MTDAPYVKAVFGGGLSGNVYIGTRLIGHLEWNKHREPPFVMFVPHEANCPDHLAHAIKLKGQHQTMNLRRMIWSKQEAHSKGLMVEADQPIALAPEQDPRATIEQIARDLMTRGTDADDRRQGRRLLGAVQAMWAEDGAEVEEAPVLRGADLVEAIRDKCPVTTDVED